MDSVFQENEEQKESLKDHLRQLPTVTLEKIINKRENAIIALYDKAMTDEARSALAGLRHRHGSRPLSFWLEVQAAWVYRDRVECIHETPTTLHEGESP